MNEYLIGYGGGRGPDEWHAEAKVAAETLRAALETFEKGAEASVVVYSVEQVG